MPVDDFKLYQLFDGVLVRVFGKLFSTDVADKIYVKYTDTDEMRTEYYNDGFVKGKQLAHNTNLMSRGNANQIHQNETDELKSIIEDLRDIVAMQQDAVVTLNQEAILASRLHKSILDVVKQYQTPSFLQKDIDRVLEDHELAVNEVRNG